MTTCPKDQELLEKVLGLLEASRHLEVAAHLGACSRCAAAAGALERTVDRIRPDAGEFDDPAFVSDLMTMVRAGAARQVIPTPERRVPRWWWAAAMAAVLPAAAGIALWVHSWPDRDAAFAVRGSTASDPDRWVSLRVLRATSLGYEEPSGRIRADDALAFAYRNGGEQPYRYLMVLAVDQRGSVFWYYPAYERYGQNPESVRVEPTGAGPARPLGQQVRHAMQPGEIKLLGVFSHTPWTVQDVERAVARDLARSEGLERLQRLQLPGTGQHVVALRVEASWQ